MTTLEKITLEQEELSQRLVRLRSFLSKDPQIDPDQIRLLKLQLNAMELYNHILSERIKDMSNVD
jgi:hypothetical protein